MTRSDFVLDLTLNASAFPNDGAAHYWDWQSLLSKVTLRGVADVQRFLNPLSRVYFDGGLYLNGVNRLPFVYDGYMTYRYIRSAALGGENMHFHMVNFFQFMLKGYYFMGLPTQYIAVPLYPEAAVELYQIYQKPLSAALAGEGSRVIDYATLYDLCQELNIIAQEDVNSKLYYFLTCLLMDLGLNDMLYDRLGYLEDWLDFLDPESAGLTVRVDGDTETWVLGGTTVFAKDADGFALTLPDPDGYEYAFGWHRGDESVLQCAIRQNGEDYANLTVTLTGLPDEGAQNAQGRVDIALTGDGFYQPIPPQSFAYSYEATGAEFPRDVRFLLDWLHPETGLPAISADFSAQQTQQPYTVLIERDYVQDDFFHLNESYMAEYKERFTKTLLLAAAPFLLETPAGVVSDVVAFMDTTGLLAFFGIE